MPKVKFSIQEYTQGSSKKVYGPYVGHFHKYTAAELKKAATAKGKVKFTMKPVVKLAKGKNNMKGGGLTGPTFYKIVKIQWDSNGYYSYLCRGKTIKYQFLDEKFKVDSKNYFNINDYLLEISSYFGNKKSYVLSDDKGKEITTNEEGKDITQSKLGPQCIVKNKKSATLYEYQNDGSPNGTWKEVIHNPTESSVY